MKVFWVFLFCHWGYIDWSLWKPKKMIRANKYYILYSFYIVYPIYCSNDDLSSRTHQVLIVSPTASKERMM